MPPLIIILFVIAAVGFIAKHFIIIVLICAFVAFVSFLFVKSNRGEDNTLSKNASRKAERAVLLAEREREREKKALERENERLQNQRECRRLESIKQHEKDARRRAKEQKAHIKEEQKRFFEDGSSAYKLRCESREAMLTAILESVYR